MSQEKPDPRLITTRNYARRRANWQPGGKIQPPCAYREMWLSTPQPPRHDLCDGCGCDCHAMTAADRELWRRLADEIDSYLAGPGGQETLL